MSATLPNGSPVLVRKLARKSHWGSPAQPVEQRIAEILAKVFLNDEKPYSLYQVSSEEELNRVALALNAGRSSLTEECSFAFFTPGEMKAANISLTQTPGQTPCHYANQLHFDADATESQLQALVTQAISSGRSAERRSKGQMKQVVQQATLDQCPAAVSDSPGCKAPGCPASAS